MSAWIPIRICLKISGVIEGAPAADVDLRANDIIYEVDGVSTAGKTLTEP